MNLTKNFKLSEFNSNDGTKMPSDVLENIKILVKQLQYLREYTDKIIYINSGYRSNSYNLKIGGSKNSQHKLGKAADIRIEDIDPKVVYELIEYLIKDNQMLQGGLGKYKTFTHYDIRGTKARW